MVFCLFGMLPKSQRLSKNRIAYLLKKGKKTGNGYFTLKYLPTIATSSRFSVSISIAVLPKAVDRNHLRRQIYEILRLKKDALKKQYDVMIMVKSPTKELKTYQDLETTVLNTLNLLSNQK